MIVCRLSFLRKNNLSTFIFGSSHPEVFSKKVLNILAKSLKYVCGGYFIIKLQAVICIYSTNELLYRHFSGSSRLYLNFIISMYLHLHHQFHQKKLDWHLFDFLLIRHSKLSIKNYCFQWLVFCLVSVILKPCTFKSSLSEN